ncbi:MAG: beta strand repeat-containing protein, partial [Candidatus Spyradosoma sp.]
MSGYSGAMSAASGKTATFTFTNQTGTGTITATNASSILNLTGATVNNSAISVSTVNIGGSTSFVTTTDLNSGNIVLASGAAMSVASTGALDLSSSTLNASNGTVSVAASGSLNLSGARVTLGSAIANSGTVTVNANTIFVLSDSLKVGDTGNTYSLISGGNITDWSTLTAANFRISGATISLRGASADVSTDGQVAFTAGTAANLTWKAGASGTWDVQGAQNWTNDSSGADDVFYDYDSVKFDTTGDVTVAIAAGGVTADTVTISAGTVSFTTNKVTAQSGFVVENGATLKLAANNNLGGKVTVKTGGVLDVNGNQADLSTNGLTEVILAGGKLANNSSTSAGTNLQQLWKITLTADSSIGGVQSNGNSGGNFGLVGSGHGTTTLDLGGYKLTKQDGGIFYLVNTTITAGTFEIAGGTVQLEQAASNGSAADFVLSGGSLNLNGKNLSAKSVSGTSGTITLGAGTLTIGTGVTEESVKTFSGTVDGGSGTLTKAGLGTIVFSGNTTIGTYNLNAGTTEFSGTATITTLTQNAGTLTIGGATTVTGNYQGSSGTGNYSVLTVDAGASLSVGGNLTLRQENNNDTGATMNVSGNVSVGGNFWIARDGKGIVNINDGGTVVAN